MDLCIGDRVVIDRELVGTIVKIWASDGEGYRYTVFVNEYNATQTYKRKNLERFMAYPTRMDNIDKARQDIAMGRA